MRQGVEQEEMKEEDVEEDEGGVDGGRAVGGERGAEKFRRREGWGGSGVGAVHSFGGAAATLFLPTFLFTAGPVHKYVE